MASFETCEEFTSRYGYTPQEYLVKVVLGLIHVNPARYDVEGIDPSERAQGIAGDETRKKAALAFVDGTLPFENLLPYMGPVSGDIVHLCAWDEAEIKAAVAARA